MFGDAVVLFNFTWPLPALVALPTFTPVLAVRAPDTV
jgi:hypothetical protein